LSTDLTIDIGALDKHRFQGVDFITVRFQNLFFLILIVNF